MPNYAHLIFHLKEETIVPQSGLTALQKPNNVTQTILSERITKFMKSIKNISAREANKVQKKNGTFW